MVWNTPHCGTPLLRGTLMTHLKAKFHIKTFPYFELDVPCPYVLEEPMWLPKTPRASKLLPVVVLNMLSLQFQPRNPSGSWNGWAGREVALEKKLELCWGGWCVCGDGTGSSARAGLAGKGGRKSCWGLSDWSGLNSTQKLLFTAGENPLSWRFKTPIKKFRGVFASTMIWPSCLH